MFHMENETTPGTPPETPTRDALMSALAELTRKGSPAISSLAQWVLAQPQELAFHSVRGLAEAARRQRQHGLPAGTCAGVLGL